jgi:DNA repair protein RadC
LSINSGYRWSWASVFPASDADIKITSHVREALKLMDIELLDHLILTYEEKHATIDID